MFRWKGGGRKWEKREEWWLTYNMFLALLGDIFVTIDWLDSFNIYLRSVWIELILLKLKTENTVAKLFLNRWIVPGTHFLWKSCWIVKFVGPMNSARDPLMCWKWLKSQNFLLLFMYSTWTVAFVSNYACNQKKKQEKGKRKRGKHIRRIQTGT